MMTAIGRLWILGAADPEMEAIERLLGQADEVAVYASSDGLRRVYASDAYRDDLTVIPSHTGRDGRLTVYTVECAPPRMEGAEHVRIDHHRPGDPGYGRPPAEFLPASSIGQVVAALALLGRIPASWTLTARSTGKLGDIISDADRPGWGVIVRAGEPGYGMGHYDDGSADAVVALIPERSILTAAADHCLAAAYRGECPGVEPDELMAWRIRSRSAFQGRPEAELLADVESALAALRDAPALDLHDPAVMPHTEDHDWSRSVCDGCAVDPVLVRDMRGRHVPELPEASAREGMCFIADGLPDTHGRVKIVCQSGSPAEIRAFMGDWAPAQGLSDIYGDPARGFAGGYDR